MKPIKPVPGSTRYEYDGFTFPTLEGAREEQVSDFIYDADPMLDAYQFAEFIYAHRLELEQLLAAWRLEDGAP